VKNKWTKVGKYGRDSKNDGMISILKIGDKNQNDLSNQ